MKDFFALEISKTFKNQYKIIELQGVIDGLDDSIASNKAILSIAGDILFRLLPLYESSGATDHDFAQLINCNIRKHGTTPGRL